MNPLSLPKGVVFPIRFLGPFKKQITTLDNELQPNPGSPRSPDDGNLPQKAGYLWGERKSRGTKLSLQRIGHSLLPWMISNRAIALIPTFPCGMRRKSSSLNPAKPRRWPIKKEVSILHYSQKLIMFHTQTEMILIPDESFSGYL